MRNVNRFLLGAVAAGSATLLIAGPALADPPSVPPSTAVAGVGSDTTEGVIGQLTKNFDATQKKWVSWDATPQPSNIVTKVGAPSIARPDGSSSGIAALLQNQTYKDSTAKTRYVIDYARSSRGRGTESPSAVSFVAFAKDAVTWAANGTTNAPLTLTPTQLQAIYSCTATKWNQVGGTSTATIFPVLPQNGSGTRSFFLGAIGVTTPGACVDQGVQENEGTDPVFSGANAKNVLVPYAISKYLAQTVHNQGAGDQGNLKLKKINNIAPVVANKINPSFPATFQRLVYNVVRTQGGAAGTIARGDGATSGVALFGPSGFICAKGSKTIANFGFTPLPSGQCGAIS